MSVLSVIQSHCRKHALAVPSSVIGSTDTQTLQLYEVLQEVLEEMVTESKFNVTTVEATRVLAATESQGLMSVICPSGYQFGIFETFFDRTLRRPLYGPMSETEWQQIKALPNPGPFYKFRIRGDELLINPVPTAPFSTIAFEYMSSWCVKTVAGVLKAATTLDSDVFTFPENILKRGVAFRWKQIKGLPYQADEKAYWDMLNNYIAKDKVKRRINVSCGAPVDIRPGVFVPAGSWPV